MGEKITIEWDEPRDIEDGKGRVVYDGDDAVAQADGFVRDLGRRGIVPKVTKGSAKAAAPKSRAKASAK